MKISEITDDRNDSWKKHWGESAWKDSRRTRSRSGRHSPPEHGRCATFKSKRNDTKKFVYFLKLLILLINELLNYVCFCWNNSLLSYSYLFSEYLETQNKREKITKNSFHRMRISLKIFIKYNLIWFNVFPFILKKKWFNPLNKLNKKK